MKKLPIAAIKIGTKFIGLYYNNMFGLNHNKLTFQTIQARSILNLLKNYDKNKTGTDNLSGELLKDAADILGTSKMQFCNISIKLIYNKYLIFQKNLKQPN